MPTPGDISNLQPSLFKASHPPIRVVSLHEHQLNNDVLGKFMNHSIVALAGEYKSGRLSQLILALPREALRIRISSPKASKERPKNNDILSHRILLNPGVTLIAFNLDRLALALHCDMDLRINNGVDLLSLSPEKTARTSANAVAEFLAGRETINRQKVVDIFRDEKDTSKRNELSILRAWSAYHMAFYYGHLTPKLTNVMRIDSSGFEKKQLDLLAQLLKVSFKLEALKPTFVKNDISEHISLKKGKLQVIATRYKTKPRISGSQSLLLEVKGKNGGPQKGRVVGVNGKNVSISTDMPLRESDLRGIATIGREAPTSAESLKAEILLKTLQGTISLFQNPLITSIWFSSKGKSSNSYLATNSTFSSERPKGVKIQLNPSQIKAVRAMLRQCPPNDEVAVTMVHGPPGSGKTSVAAGFVEAIQNRSRTEYGEAVYLTAQSNVAVKNMAEKLAKIGFTNWKLIVSRDFHFEWHEHLYEAIRDNVIESANLPETDLEVARLFRGARVILCTLSMLSNTRLGKNGLTRRFPPRTIIVDEASQIELGDYLPVFHIFRNTLRRICFVGDDKQLAPFGQEDIPELQSIFDIPNIRAGAIFLDTQYRMPTAIGDFISRKVYGGRLKSCHSNNTKTSCRWVDVGDGIEEVDGRSWKNRREIQMVVRLVRQSHRRGEDFRVITPYDPQRNELERALKQAGLPWENRCFNVDSFQGNEAGHIIISIVRTKKPGFLTNQRRTNVLLTRCKNKMTICTNRYFLEHEARKTLIGSMAAAWGADGWVSEKDVLNGRI